MHGTESQAFTSWWGRGGIFGIAVIASLSQVALAQLARDPVTNQPVPSADNSEASKTEPAPSATPVPAAPKPLTEAQKAELAELLLLLGDEDYQARESAATKLQKFGLDAREALKSGMENADPEVRARCRRIWAIVRRSDFEQRLNAFKANPNSPDHRLAGWPQFVKMVGDTPAARDLFIQMQRCEGLLLEHVEAAPTTAAGEVAARVQTLQQMMSLPNFHQQLPLGTTAALMYLGSREDLHFNENSMLGLYNFIHSQHFQNAIRIGSGEDRPARRLLGVWISNSRGSSLMFQNMMLAMNQDLKEGLPLAVRMLKDKQQQGIQRAYAAVAVGKLGGKKCVEMLEPLLDDATVCMQHQINNKQVPIQVRDIALGVMVFLTEQPLAAYGFEHANLGNNQILSNPFSFCFKHSDARDLALRKWREWSAQQKVKSS